MKPSLKLLRLRGVPIQEQLRIEEAIFRVEKQHNWFLLNQESTPPTIVMGIGGKPDQLLHADAVKRDNIPVLKRFTGGGTVIVDQDTVFTTFICKQDSFPHVKPYPREIMSWSNTFFSPLFDRLCGHQHTFGLREDDYVFDDKKIAGNAQSISKDRWLHHTSFLWQFQPSNMEYLTNPARQPKYREQRSHLEFLQPLQSVLEDKRHFLEELEKELHHHFQVENVTVEDIEDILQTEHRQATRFIQLE